VLLPLLILALPATVRGTVLDDLIALRNGSLYYAVGRAPNDPNTVTIRHGLYAQSPSSPAGEIDLAATGFSLAALPSAVENGRISYSAALALAEDAAQRVSEMVANSAGALTPAEIEMYGYRGVLFHYYVWNDVEAEFRGQPGTEISSIDTTLLMYGLLVSANYFGGHTRAAYEAARDQIQWSEWLEQSDPDHLNQFRMAYYPRAGFAGWWDWYTQEVMLISLFAAMSDAAIDAPSVWRAWTRDEVTYSSPSPDPRTFTCIATFNGDPFTVFYGLAFLDLDSLGRDLDGVDWFEQGQIAYRGHVEFFKKERGYLDDLSFAFFDTSTGAIAEPKSNPDAPIVRTDSPVYSVAGGLAYYSAQPASNEPANALSLLVTSTPDFFDWHGWPVAAIHATDAGHPVSDARIIGQHISLIAVSIDNYLTNRVWDLVLQDRDFQETRKEIFPEPQVPALNPWGRVLLAFLMFIAIVLMIRRQRLASA
jgi:hypothetical protein